MKKCVRLHLTGTVQSLFFRQFVKSSAEQNNIRGFLRNLEDGRMEILLEGDALDVDNMIAVCSQGPQHAKIRTVDQKEERLQDFKDFRILTF